jgi:hypothetical protein
MTLEELLRYMKLINKGVQKRKWMKRLNSYDRIFVENLTADLINIEVFLDRIVNPGGVKK